MPGISKPTYTPEEIEEFNRKENEPVEYNGKTYTKYEATQRQRKLETTMRAQRQEIKLLKEGGASEDDLIAARSRYRGTSAEYARFSKAMDLPQQRERVTVDGLGNIGVGKYKIPVDKSSENSIIKESSNSKQIQNELHPFGEKGNTGSDLFSTEAKAKLLQRENEIQEYRTEKAVIFSSDGTELLSKEGDANSVTFTKEECEGMKSCILTHNHPDDSTFSPNDVAFLLRNGLSEIRDRISHGTYILQRTPATLNRKPALKTVENAFYDEYERLGNKYRDIAAQNGTSIVHYLRKIDEESIDFLAKKYGLNYRLEVDNYD